ncbi:sensor histidine kinase [Candidatus Pyrohabitans sp.]
MSTGVIFNIIYWGYERTRYHMSFYEHFMMSPVAAVLIGLLIPLMILVGYGFIREHRLRFQMKEAHQKLERTYNELKEIDELKSNIIANVSHELRTPITIAKGFIELAAMEEDDEERRDELMSATAALHRLNDIVEDLIQVAAVQRGDLTLHKKSVSLAEIVNSAVKEKEDEARKRNVKLEVDLAYEGEILADAIKLKRAILNLLDNAIKFNRTGGEVRVKVSKEGDLAMIAVSDTGIGIPEDRLRDVFKPLTQLDPSPTRRYGGTGTGLAVAKRIIEAHGGKIWVESEVGKGTTVYVILPLHRSA